MAMFGNSLAVRNGPYARVLGSPSLFVSKCFGFGWPRICLSPRKAIGVRIGGRVQANSRQDLGFGKNLGEGLALGFDVVSSEELQEKGFLGMRKTKLVCTVGPSCRLSEELERPALGRMNVARLNMCHNTREWHCEVLRIMYIIRATNI